MKKSVLLSVTLAALASSPVLAQDIHFSQFNASPLTLNPALAGKLECTYRAAVNYRDQWRGIPALYQTYSAGFDIGVGKGRLGKEGNEAVGLGVLVMNDVSGDGGLSNLSANGFLAYHKELGEHSVMSVGFQGVYSQRGVNIGALLFGDQIINGTLYTVDGPFNEKMTYMDVNAGFHWSSFWEYFSFNLGGAYYHIMEPNETFMGDPNNTLGPRYVGHGGFSVAIGEYVTLSPSFLYMQQTETNQLNAGASLGYHMEDVALYGGVWHRRVRGAANADAIIALAGIDFANFTLGLSYDISVSEITEANNGKGGFELSLTYNGCITSRPNYHCPAFKPRF